MLVLVTGGAGYLGSLATRALLEAGHDVRVLDSALHDQYEVIRALERAGADVHVADVRDAEARSAALRRVDAVVHLAAIVGDPACAIDPRASHDVNVTASNALIADLAGHDVGHLVFASTCSNYGVVRSGEIVDESSPLNPASHYARQKVDVEQTLLDRPSGIESVTCLRFATLYGVSPRMRFDLLVNEFVRDCWQGRPIEVYGGTTWRPYVHVRDAATAIVAAIEQRHDAADSRVYNVGIDMDNHQKRDVADRIADLVGTGTVRHVATGPDARSYRVSFERIAAELAPSFEWTVDEGVEEIVRHLESGTFGDTASPRYVNA